MECFYAKGTLSTDKISNEFISVNNFGYNRCINQNLCVKRKKGRLDYQIIYIDKGYGQFLIKDRFIEIHSGCIVILQPGAENHYEFSADSLADYYWIHFTGFGVPGLLKNLQLEENMFDVGELFEFKKTFESMAKAVATEDFTTDSYLSSCMYMLLAKIAKRVHIPDNPLRKVLICMQNENINTLSNADYARMCGLSEYHFIRTFKKRTGMTPHQYLAKITVNKAMELISTTDLNITEIAHALGFNDNLYFSRFFKKATGRSPKNFIKE